MTGGPAAQRADKWLYFARFFKTRALAAAVVEGGHLRVNGIKAAKAAHNVRAGDVLTFVQADRVRVVRVDGAGQRRGPATEAQTLYTDMDVPVAGATADDRSDAVPEAGTPSLSSRGRLD